MSTLRDETPLTPPARENSPCATSVREQFIPLRKAELVVALAGSPGLSAAQTTDFRRLCRLVDVLLHCEYHAGLARLKAA